MADSSELRGIFKDRQDALVKLLEVMPVSSMQERDYIVIASSQRGVIFAQNIAKALNAPMEFLFSEPILAPNNPECQIGMVSETKEIVIYEQLLESFDISIDFIYGEATRKFEEKILKNIYKYRKGATVGSMVDKDVLFVDEGIDSGLTMMLSIKTAYSQKARTVSVATPVIPNEVLVPLESITDEVFYLYRPADFVDTAYYYKEFYGEATEKIERALAKISKSNITKKDKDE
ncbi:MAG: phosphoribosyltransferase [Campylobacterales bacterium]